MKLNKVNRVILGYGVSVLIHVAASLSFPLLRQDNNLKDFWRITSRPDRVTVFATGFASQLIPFNSLDIFLQIDLIRRGLRSELCP